MLYRILKLIVSLGIKLYYRKVRILNKHLLPTDGPYIYIANHPNTLMDAWLIGYTAKTPLYFMAKGTFFNSPFKKKILTQLHMIPINRLSDKSVEGVSNKASFEACYNLLSEHKSLLIFPEGTSFLERKLRSLKSGTARIALETCFRFPDLNLKVIPIGLNYLQANKFRSDVVIHIGKTIDVQDYLSDYQDNNSLASKKLTEVFRIHLEQTLVNSEDKALELITEDLAQFFKSKYKKNTSGKQQLILLKQIRDRIDELIVVSPWKIEEIKQQYYQLREKLSKTEISSDFLDRKFRIVMFIRQLFFSSILLILGLPLFLLGFIYNFIPYFTTDFLIPKISKDIEYYAPLAVLLGLFFYPLTYFAILYTLESFFPILRNYTLIHFTLMPVSGVIAYSIAKYFKHIRMKWKFITLLFKDREQLAFLKKEKEKLYDLVFEN